MNKPKTSEEARAQIEEMVDRETRAWDTQDVELLMTLFHPDMVWPWPPTPQAHDPAEWVMVMGRFGRERWKQGWAQLFEDNKLQRNQRRIEKIVASKELDGAFAVVDIDTVWRERKSGTEQQWKGRVCKVYTWMGSEWKMIMHTGVLEY